MKFLNRAAMLPAMLNGAFFSGTNDRALGRLPAFFRFDTTNDAGLPTGTVIVLSIIGIFILIGIFMMIRLLRED